MKSGTYSRLKSEFNIMENIIQIVQWNGSTNYPVATVSNTSSAGNIADFLELWHSVNGTGRFYDLVMNNRWTKTDNVIYAISKFENVKTAKKLLKKRNAVAYRYYVRYVQDPRFLFLKSGF